MVDLDAIARGEAAENFARKDFTLSEAVAVRDALDLLERAAAKKRQREHGSTAPGRKADTGGKLPPVKAKSRDKETSRGERPPRRSW